MKLTNWLHTRTSSATASPVCTTCASTCSSVPPLQSMAIYPGQSFVPFIIWAQEKGPPSLLSMVTPPGESYGPLIIMYCIVDSGEGSANPPVHGNLSRSELCSLLIILYNRPRRRVRPPSGPWQPIQVRVVLLVSLYCTVDPGEGFALPPVRWQSIQKRVLFPSSLYCTVAPVEGSTLQQVHGNLSR